MDNDRDRDFTGNSKSNAQKWRYHLLFKQALKSFNMSETDRD